MPNLLLTWIQSFSRSFHVDRVLAVASFYGTLWVVFLGKDGLLYRAPLKNNHRFALRKKVTMTFERSSEENENLHVCSGFRFRESEHGFFVTYQRTEGGSVKTIVASSSDLKVWSIHREFLGTKDPAVMTEHKHYDSYFAFTSTPTWIEVHTSKTGKRWSSRATIDVSTVEGYFQSTPLRVLGVDDTSDGVLVIFDASYKKRGYQLLQIGAIMVAYDNPGHTLWKLHTPLWKHFVEECDEELVPLSCIFDDDSLHMYYRSGDTDIFSVTLPNGFSNLDIDESKAHLHKYECNPVVEPDPDSVWQNHSTFNPAAFLLDDKVHILYRAEGYIGLSRLGYGHSHDGLEFSTLPHPVLTPREDFEGCGVPPTYRPGPWASGHAPVVIDDTYYGPEGWHGCEDPRATVFDDRVYVLYAAFPGWTYARPAFTSISLDDFRSQNWNWSKPVAMTPWPRAWGEGSKNVCLLPEKINGKYVIFHRVWPDICIDYVDTLEFGEDSKWLGTKARIKPSGSSWDSRKIAVGGVPLKTKYGWLLIYQGMGWSDTQSMYKIGAMLVDLKDPSKVLYRSSHPILTPTEWYENAGHKYGVAFPCGAVIKDDTLYVYYGGSDKHVCVATAPLDEFLENLMSDPVSPPVLTKINL